MGVHPGAPPPLRLACGQATSALLRLNRHRSTNSDELLVLTRYLHHPDSVVGRRDGHAAAAVSRAPLLLVSVRRRVLNHCLPERS